LLQFKLAVNPPFNESLRSNNTPQEGSTTFLLRSALASDASTLAKMLDFGLTGGNDIVNCVVSADPDSSSLTLTFAHFDADLDYDPGTLISPLLAASVTPTDLVLHRYVAVLGPVKC
jgi:hypothetical protein